MTPTEQLLFEEFKRPIVRLDEICHQYLMLAPTRAKTLAARHALGLPTFRLIPSQKSPWMVTIAELAAHIDRTAAQAKAAWKNSQL